MNRSSDRAFRRVTEVAISSASLLSVFALWEILSRASFIDSGFFPAPSTVLRRLAELLSADRGFAIHVGDSLRRLFIGTVLALPAAISLGMIVSLNRIASRILSPLIAVTYPLPKLALFPLFLIVFGIGEASKIAIIAIGVFYLVLLNTIRGVEVLVASGVYDIVKIYRIPFHTRMIRIVLRGTLPEILSGIKSGVGYGLVMVVAGEFTVASSGIGVFIWNAWDRFSMVDMYCGLFVLSALGLFLFTVLDAVKGRYEWSP